jgi:hypothetical protein
MAKWAPNSELKEIWTEGREIKSETGVLGVTWNTGSDSLLFEYRDITDGLQEEPATKRQVLRATENSTIPSGYFLQYRLWEKYSYRIHGAEALGGTSFPWTSPYLKPQWFVNRKDS